MKKIIWLSAVEAEVQLRGAGICLASRKAPRPCAFGKVEGQVQGGTKPKEQPQFIRTCF